MKQDLQIDDESNGCLLRGHKLCTGTSCLQTMQAPDPALLSPYVPLDFPNICRHAGEARSLVREWEHLFCSLQNTPMDAPELLLVCGRLYRARKNWRSFPVGPTVRRLLSTVDIDAQLRRIVGDLDLKGTTQSHPPGQGVVSQLIRWDDIEILEAFRRTLARKIRTKTAIRPLRCVREKLSKIKDAVWAAARTVRDYSINVCIAARSRLITSRTWAPTMEKFVALADSDTQ